jgi:hypothetical protein
VPYDRPGVYDLLRNGQIDHAYQEACRWWFIHALSQIAAREKTAKR